MDLNCILENEKYKKLTDDSIGKTYYRYKLQSILDFEDFEQEVYLFMINRITKYDETKSSLDTYIPLMVMTCAKRKIMLAQGRIKDINKLELNLNSISLDSEINNVENNKPYSELIGECDEDILNKVLVDEIIKTSSLSEKQRTVLQLISKGNNISEVARILNKSTSCVNITFQRAKEKILRKYII